MIPRLRACHEATTKLLALLRRPRRAAGGEYHKRDDNSELEWSCDHEKFPGVSVEEAREYTETQALATLKYPAGVDSGNKSVLQYA